MKAAFLLFGCMLFRLSLVAQTPADGCPEEHVKYYNGFQHTKHLPEKQDAAFSHARNLAKACPGSLQSLFHTWFAQSFSKRIIGNRPNTTERKLLDRLLQDTSQVIRQTLEPMIFWIKAQDNEHHVAELRRLTREFSSTQLQPGDWYKNRTARYALLIYQIVQPKNELAGESQHLLSKTITGLQTQLKGYSLPGEAVHNWTRAWCRYLYAYSNFLLGEEYLRKGNRVEAEKYYKTAAEYSPDAIDKNARSGYGYEIAFLGTAEYSDGFGEQYLSFLESNSNRDETLKILTELAFTDAANLDRLQVFYTQHFAAKESFQVYWEKQLTKLPPAPLLQLKLLNSADFSIESHTGKWVLLDFWGTWCAPCIEEMPQLQTFYREINSRHTDKIALLTIACQDTELKVKTFMNKHRYNFPAAVSDGKVEQSFSVTAFPSRILITPNGNMLLLANGENWLEQVKVYCGLR